MLTEWWTQTLKADLEAKQLAKEIKEVALKAGADLVGIVSASAIDTLPSILVGWTIQEHTKKTTDIMPNAKSIVVIGYHVWDDMLEIAIQKGEKWVYPGYLPLRTLSLKVIHHLEKKGYNAVASGLLSYKRLAQLAGFGNFGKNALIINPTFGPWLRLMYTPNPGFNKCRNDARQAFRPRLMRRLRKLHQSLPSRCINTLQSG